MVSLLSVLLSVLPLLSVLAVPLSDSIVSSAVLNYRKELSSHQEAARDGVAMILAKKAGNNLSTMTEKLKMADHQPNFRPAAKKQIKNTNGVVLDESKIFKDYDWLNLIAPEEIGDSQEINEVKNYLRLNLIAPEEIGNSTETDSQEINEVKNYLRLNLIAPEEIGKSTETDSQESKSYVKSELIVSDLNLGIPGDFEELNKFEGDIELPSGFSYLRKATWRDRELWPRKNGVPTIYYSFSNPGVSEERIMEGMEYIEQHTCIRFKKSSWFRLGPRLIFRNSRGCSSLIGRVSDIVSFFFGQPIRLAAGCSSLPTVVHEIGHALGLYHEQSRSDRDDHVAIIYENIQSDKVNNFEKRNTRNYDTEYDYYSVMQYGPMSFSENGDSTLVATDIMGTGLMAIARIPLTHMDKLILNTMYKCIDDWVSDCPDLSEDPCQNLGYLAPDCSCVCPEGTDGDNCETKIMSYTDALVAKFLPESEKITSEVVISTTSYPTPYLPSIVFTKEIEAPPCHKVVLTVVGFDLESRSSRRCRTEGLEIRLDDPITSGHWYCGAELTEDQTLESVGRTLVLFYQKSTLSSNTHAGFKLQVDFEPDDDTTETCDK